MSRAANLRVTDRPELAPGRIRRAAPAAVHDDDPALAAALPHYELVGPPNAPVVIALGGISATAHVTSTADDPTPGWWEEVSGAARPLDTTRYRVLGVEFLDGGRGAAGQPARVVTTHDQARAIVGLLDHLGVARAHAVVGSSYGGMVALALAAEHPERVARLVVISAAHEPHPMTTAVRAVQRRIVALGLETGRGNEAMALARALAMTTYRSEREFAERFDCAPLAGAGTTFPVERYLAHCGEKFAASFTSERFLALSLSGDLHRVDPAAIRAPTTLVAAEGDRVVPESQLQDLATRLGGPCRFVRLRTRFGHDAFLTEPQKIGRILATSLDEPLP